MADHFSDVLSRDLEQIIIKALIRSMRFVHNGYELKTLIYVKLWIGRGTPEAGARWVPRWVQTGSKL
jgi:hypothetical protein